MEPRARLVQMCIDRCMSKKQAEIVVGLAIKKIDNVLEKEIGYKINWFADNYDLPDAFYKDNFRLYVAPVALKWIDENIPKAWFRSMFDLNPKKDE